MKKSGIVFSLLLGIGLLSLTSCNKNSDKAAAVSPQAPAKTQEVSQNTAEKPIDKPAEQPAETKMDVAANHNVKAVNLRGAEDFAILAHASITSFPSSTITGKVGLRPGTRDLIGVDPSEVAGGIAEIYATNDVNTTATAFLTKAKIDMINAFNDGETRVADADKIDLYAGLLGGKVIPAGVYQWKTRVTIPLDLKLEGTDTDVFIFKIAGQLRVGSDVKVTLSGGAQAKNVFWIVGDDVLIKAKSDMVGTIISQQAFEMKEGSTLIGRAFVKNDKLVINKSTITKP